MRENTVSLKAYGCHLEWAIRWATWCTTTMGTCAGSRWRWWTLAAGAPRPRRPPVRRRRARMTPCRPSGPPKSKAGTARRPSRAGDAKRTGRRSCRCTAGSRSEPGSEKKSHITWHADVSGTTYPELIQSKGPLKLQSFAYRDLPDPVVELVVVLRLELLLPLPVRIGQGPQRVGRVHGRGRGGGHPVLLLVLLRGRSGRRGSEWPRPRRRGGRHSHIHITFRITCSSIVHQDRTSK